MTTLQAIESLMSKGYDCISIRYGTEIAASLGNNLEGESFRDIYDTYSAHFTLSIRTDEDYLILTLKPIQ